MISRLKGIAKAQQAIRELLKNDDVSLTTVLEAFSGANPLAVNWLRGAFESLADQRLKTTKTLPKKQLETFVLDTRHDPRARRVAYEWLVKVDDTATSRIIPGMLNDPSVEFRRDAVARLLTQADTLFEDGKKSESQPIYEMALTGARDDDQIKSIVDKLRELGQEVDLPEHFGLLLSWKLIGPFDNSDEAGFDVTYPPETKIDPDGKYQGKDSTEVSWIDYATADEYGIVDLTKAAIRTQGGGDVCLYRFCERRGPVGRIAARHPQRLEDVGQRRVDFWSRRIPSWNAVGPIPVSRQIA